MSGELASERWSPAQRIFTVLISILSLLDDAEVSSAANVDASVMLRKDPEAFKKIVRDNVEASKRDMPAGFKMPDANENKPMPKEDVDDDFWCDSDGDSDFGVDSDEDMQFGRW
jgi:ubiquitin-conjugating enzyme E2 R